MRYASITLRPNVDFAALVAAEQARLKTYWDHRLDKLPADRLCPKCGRGPLRSAQFVCYPDGRVICKKCECKENDDRRRIAAGA